MDGTDELSTAVAAWREAVARRTARWDAYEGAVNKANDALDAYYATGVEDVTAWKAYWAAVAARGAAWDAYEGAAAEAADAWKAYLAVRHKTHAAAAAAQE